MRRIILQEKSHIYPFNEAARDLRVHNVPLWLWQRDLLSRYVTEEREYPDLRTAQEFEQAERVEVLAHKDNLFFNRTLLDDFIRQSRAEDRPTRIAFRKDDPAIGEHVLPLSKSFVEQGQLLLADLWYLPEGFSQVNIAEPFLMDCEAREVGYYHVPQYMADASGDLIYHLPRRALVSLENWVHLFVINILFGVFARGKDMEDKVEADWRYRLKVLYRALLEQKQVLDCSELVKIGKNAIIDPSVVIHGPTTIGNNVTIGPGTVIDNCIIGNNVNISQGSQLMLSVVSDGCFLPFRASLFMTTLMENTMVAQNTCLQLCVVGRDTFIGAGTTFTDFKVLPGTLRTSTGPNQLGETNMLVLGGCVGHHCRLSSGLIIYPARTVESDVVLLAEGGNQIIKRNVRYEDSDHHSLSQGSSYPRLYPRTEQSTQPESYLEFA